jgi:secreted PhoX family phosphatase
MVASVGVTGIALGDRPSQSSQRWRASSLQLQNQGAIARFGPLQRDPNGIIDLPVGFRYRVISQMGDRMDDGYLVPGAHDGMAAFQAPDGQTVLIRNHELLPTSSTQVMAAAERLYDPRCKGGTTTIVVSPQRTVVRQFTSLAGTSRNCAGGATPWQSWLSCEEITSTPASYPSSSPEAVTKPHGYAFEVPMKATEPVMPQPLTAMGRFRREAIAVDPQTGIVYQTEDQEDGLFYRFIPHEVNHLSAGGRLEALRIQGRPQAITRRNFPINRPVAVEWVTLENADPVDDTLRSDGFRQGAAQFSRGEGICYSDGEIYFTCTNAGRIPHGQIWRYQPGQSATEGGMLELIVEPNDPNQLDFPDNLVMASWGDLLVCEDGGGAQFIVGVTPDGRLYRFAHNALNTAEFAGICFALDGQTLFLNIYSPGLTLAIWPESGQWS